MIQTTHYPDVDLINTIIAMECAALDRWGKGDPSGFLEICAPDIVCFDPNLERRIDGRDTLGKYVDKLGSLLLPLRD